MFEIYLSDYATGRVELVLEYNLAAEAIFKLEFINIVSRQPRLDKRVVNWRVQIWNDCVYSRNYWK